MNKRVKSILQCQKFTFRKDLYSFFFFFTWVLFSFWHINVNWQFSCFCHFAGITSQTALGQRRRRQTGGTRTNLCQVNVREKRWCKQKTRGRSGSSSEETGVVFEGLQCPRLSSVPQAVPELRRSSSCRVWSELCSWKQSMLEVWVPPSKFILYLLYITAGVVLKDLWNHQNSLPVHW